MSADYQPSEYVTVPEGWSCKRLADCTQDGAISYGIVQPGQHDESGVPVIRVNNISNDQLDLSEVLRVSPEIEEKYKRTRLQGGEVLLTLVGSTGQSFVAPAELAGWNVPRAIAVIRASEDVGADWINICLQSKETMHFLNVRANTTVQKTLNLKDVRDIPILIPPYGVKKSIESVALSLSKKVKLNRQTNQTLEQMAQAIFKSWFVDFEPVKAKIAALEAGGSEDDALLAAMQAIAGSALFATDAADADAQTQLARLQAEHPEQYATLRATAELFPSAMQESELGEIPAGWKVLPLSEMVELIGGGTPKRSEPAYWNGDICWFSVKDTPNDGNVFVIDTVEKITDAGLKGSSTKLLPLGTTIITARGTVGKLALTGVVTAMNQSCYGVIGIDGTGPYLNYLQMQEAVETLQRNTHGAVFDTITQATFGTVFQAQACISLRTNFENLVAPAFEMIKNNLQQIKALSELRDTLLPKLLSGELSVAEAE